MAGGFDKRIFKRVRVSIPVEIVDVLSNTHYIGRITDISAGGLAILSNGELEKETPISLTFTLEGVCFKNIAADVVRSIKKDENTNLGVAFFNPSSPFIGQIDSIVRHIHSRAERGMQRGKLI